MAPKRKHDALEVDDIAATDKENVLAKSAQISDADSSHKSKKVAKSRDWREVVLAGEEEGDVPVYDDCNEIRRKIRWLLKQPEFKITQWLRDIGNINHNSFQRFMRASGPTGGAGNGTYYAAYVHFEKVRIAQGKKKTAKRERNEREYRGGFPLDDPGRHWVWVHDR